MSRSSVRAAVLATALITAACGRNEPAPIELKGQHVYGRGGTSESVFSALMPAAGKPAPVYAQEKAPPPVVLQFSEETAKVESIGVNDLPPPSAAAKSEPAPQKQAAAEPVSLNRWTGKQRSEFQQAAKEPAIKPAAPQPARAAEHKPIKLTGTKEEVSSFMWPVGSKKVISGFGPKGRGKANDGINIASDEGEPVWAAADGEVVYVGNELSGYGNMIIIKHAGGKSTTYAHLSSAGVDKYDRVKQGDIIGYVGSTGNVKSPQLHFALRNGKAALDPRKYLSSSLASN